MGSGWGSQKGKAGMGRLVCLALPFRERRRGGRGMGSEKERCQDTGSHSAASCLCVFKQGVEQMTSESGAV